MKIVIVFLLALLCRLSLAEVKYSTGLIQPLDWAKHAEFLDLRTRVDLPAHFDWREKLGKQVPILNQGSCGSCWAHSRASSLAWAYLIKGQVVAPSVQELVSCDNQEMGCNGGFWDNYEVNPGISDASEFPYTGHNSRCKSGLSHDHKITQWLYVGGQNQSPSTDDIKQALVQYGPVGVTVAARGQFMSYTSGVMNGCPHGGTNHMVLIMAYDDSEGTFTIQNSWSESWGEKGFARIKYGCYSLGETAAVPVL
jgi:C1A family cysteine protease